MTLCGPDSALTSAISGANVLWVRLKHRIDAAFMASMPELKIIVTPTTGLNHIDMDEAGRRGIQVLSLRGKTEFLKDIRATAEHTIGLMLALLRHIPAAAFGCCRRRLAARSVSGKRTVRKDDRAFWLRAAGPDCCEIPVGLRRPGFGNGSAGSTRAGWRAIESVTADEVLRQSDLISLHVDLREDTRGFFNAEMFRCDETGGIFHQHFARRIDR